MILWIEVRPGFLSLNTKSPSSRSGLLHLHRLYLGCLCLTLERLIRVSTASAPFPRLKYTRRGSGCGAEPWHPCRRPRWSSRPDKGPSARCCGCHSLSLVHFWNKVKKMNLKGFCELHRILSRRWKESRAQEEILTNHVSDRCLWSAVHRELLLLRNLIKNWMAYLSRLFSK